MKLAWITDPHLDHLAPRAGVRQAFAEMVAEDSDACVISGDISTFTNAHLLGQFASTYKKPIYFVLGNHDAWGGSFDQCARKTRAICKAHSNLTWLTNSSAIVIAPGVSLCGVDGWYDAEFGSGMDSSFRMVDWNAIRDFHGQSIGEIVATSRELARGFTMMARMKLDATRAPRVIFATHIPPYEESALHEGKPSSRSAVPWYTSKCMGLALSAWANDNPHRELTTLCGHTHSPSEYKPEHNHTVLCGTSDYGKPQISRIFEL